MLKHLKQPPYLMVWLMIGCMWLLAWSTYIASSHQIEGLELAIFRHINNWPDWFRSLFLVITQAGSIWTLYAATLLALVKKRNRLAVRLFAVGAITYLLASWAKYMVMRGRPALILSDVNIRENAFGPGFPSGHTAMATALSLVLLPLIPKKLQWLVAVVILLVALSRVYLGVHAPVDVVGGFAIGSIVVLASNLVKNKLKLVTKITHLKLSD